MSGPRYPAQGSGDYAAPAYHVDAHRYIDPNTGQRLSSVAEYPPGHPSASSLNEHDHLYPAPAHRLPPIDVYNERAEAAGDFNTFSPSHDDDDPTSSQSGQSRRKPKSHVEKACVYCQKKHLACDVNRPCRRCIENGVADQCYSIPHKKRGRPPHANKEGRGGRSQRGPDQEQSSPISPYTPSYQGRVHTDPQRAMHFPILPSQSAADSYRQAYGAQSSVTGSYYGNTQYTTSPYQPVPPSSMTYGSPPFDAATQSSPPTACLTIDLRISYANPAFLKIAGCFGDPRGDALSTIVGNNDLIMLHALATELKSSSTRAARVEEIPRLEDFRTSGVDSRAEFSRTLTFKHQAGMHQAVFTLCIFGAGEFVLLSLSYVGIHSSPDPLQHPQPGSQSSPSAIAYHQGDAQPRHYDSHASITALAEHPRYTPGYSMPAQSTYPGPRSQGPSTEYFNENEAHRGYVPEYAHHSNPNYSSHSYSRSTPR